MSAGGIARPRRAQAWSYLHANHPEARFKIKRLAMGSVESGIVDVEISGPDADRLLSLSQSVRSLFQAAPGIRDNEDDWGNKIVKVVVEIDQDRARQLGITSGRDYPTPEYLFQRSLRSRSIAKEIILFRSCCGPVRTPPRAWKVSPAPPLRRTEH